MARGTKPAKLAKWRKIRHNLAMARYATGAHTKHRLQYHLAWIPKYRKRILKGKIVIRLKNLLYEACKVNGWWIIEMSIQDDHIHIVAQIPPQYSVAEVVQIFKGGTSRVLRREFPELEEFLWVTVFGRMGILLRRWGRLMKMLLISTSDNSARIHSQIMLEVRIPGL